MGYPEGKNYRNTGYLKKKYGDIHREVWGYEAAQLRGYVIFHKKSLRDPGGIPRHHPPPMGPFIIILLRGLRRWPKHIIYLNKQNFQVSLSDVRF